MMYGSLCTEFYDADKKFSPPDEMNYYKKFLNKDDLILEPMCGSGRFLIPLLQNGYSVHGFDNSFSMLNSCKERAASLGLNPTLFEGSIETISLDKQYNKIMIPYGSFQLLYPRSSAYQTLINLYKHLLPGGKLILDLFIPWEWLYENANDQVSERQIETDDKSVIKIKSYNKINKFEQYCFGESIYTKLIDGKIVAEENEQMYLSWYYHYEIELILEKAGFKNISLEEQFFNNENHLIYIAER